MAYLISKDRKLCIIGGKLITDAGGAPCLCDGSVDPPDTCPAPCLLVVLSDIQQVIGGLDHPCYLSGGTVALHAAGFDGAYLIPVVGLGIYRASFPVSISTIQSSGVPGSPITRIGGTLTIQVSPGECENGVIDDYRSVSVGVSGGVVIDENGDVIPGADWAASVFSGSGDGLTSMGNPVDNEIVLTSDGCIQSDVLSVSHGGTATVFQPPQCTLPPVYYYAAACGDSADRIVVDLSTMPPEGASGCRYNDKLYIVTEEWTQDESPITVEWVVELCDTTPDEWPIALECAGSRTITFDPDSVGADTVTVVHEGVRYMPTSDVSTDAPVTVSGSTDPCPGEWFLAVRCGSLPNRTDFPNQPVFKYRVEPGMVAGEGSVVGHWSESEDPDTPGICRHTFFLRPTTTPTTPGNDFFERQIPGDCSTAIGGRTGDCVDGVRPVRYPSVERRPGGLGTMLKGTINTAARIATLGRVKQVKQCGKCKKREEALNRFGQRLSKGKE